MAEDKMPSWYHRHISRMGAEKLLAKTGVKGAYLVRESESLQDTKVLCFLTQDGIRHHKIVRSADGKWSLETAVNAQQQLFESIEHLISYYQVKREQIPLPLTLAVSEEGASLGGDQESYDSDDEDEGVISEGQSSDSIVMPFFLQQMEVLKGKSSDDDFEKSLESYIRSGLIHDFHKVKMGATKLPQLNKVVTTELQRSLDAFTKKVEFLLELFDVGANDGLVRGSNIGQNALQSKSAGAYSADFERITSQLSTCISHVERIESKSYKVLKDYSGRGLEKNLDQQETYQFLPKADVTRSSFSRQRQGIWQLFSVSKGNSKAEMFISLNLKEGKIAFLKNKDDSPTIANTEDQENIAQLLKDKSTKTSLGITIGKKTTTYHFKDFQLRELFCHMAERMKNIHSGSRNGALSQLQIFIGTWNMGNAHPPESLHSWFRCIGNGKEKPEGENPNTPYDLVAIGTQESGLNEKELISKIKSSLQSLFKIDYHLVGKVSLWDIRLLVFVKPTHASQITLVKQSVVKTGLANALGNKGAVGLSFYFGSTSFCFVNTHQHARVGRVAKRNQNYHDALQSLNLGQKGVFDITNHFHHLFWFGDLNYRVNSLEVEKVLKLIMVNDLETLLKHDQLIREKAAGNAFFGFEEEKITFRPTYRFKVGFDNMYIWLKRKTGAQNVTNVPSWPDRILWKTFPEVFIQNIAYGATVDVLTSDHAPVFAVFDVGILSQSEDMSCHIKSGQNAVIEFLHVEAKIRTSCQTRFIMFFCSTCLEGHIESKPNSIFDWRDRRIQSNDTDHSFPAWKTDDIPKLTPALSNQGYLEDQHIQIAVKGEDGHESYGEFVLSVKRLMRGGIEEVTSALTHLGDESGEITLMVRANVDQPKNRNADMVIKNVSDLRTFGESSDNDSSISGAEAVDLDPRRRTRLNSAMSGNYEIIGNFANESEATFSEADFSFPRKPKPIKKSDVDAPPVPPKKRLSRQLSTPISGQEADRSSEIIWFEDPSISKSTSHIQQQQSDSALSPSKAPPIPRRAASVYASLTAERPDDKPRPKPRSLKSLVRDNPSSIEDWLQKINLLQYHDNLLSAGWDDLDYLDFTRDDLLDAGIQDHSHINLLLKSAELLKCKAQKHQSRS